MVGTISMPNLNDYNLMNARQKLEAEVASGMYDGGRRGFWIQKMRIEEYQGKLKNVREGVNTIGWRNPCVRNLTINIVCT